MNSGPLLDLLIRQMPADYRSVATDYLRQIEAQNQRYRDALVQILAADRIATARSIAETAIEKES